MVGSELLPCQSLSPQNPLRRPLMVGSEPKANFGVLTVKRRETGKGLQSTFGCPKTLRGSTATDPSKLGHFRLKSPPRLYPVFKVLKTAQVDGKFSTIQKKSKCLLQEPLFIRIKNGSRERWIFLRTGDDPCLERSLCLTQ